jgi:hypothetical protein
MNALEILNAAIKTIADQRGYDAEIEVRYFTDDISGHVEALAWMQQIAAGMSLNLRLDSYDMTTAWPSLSI